MPSILDLVGEYYELEQRRNAAGGALDQNSETRYQCLRFFLEFDIAAPYAPEQKTAEPVVAEPAPEEEAPPVLAAQEPVPSAPAALEPPVMEASAEPPPPPPEPAPPAEEEVIQLTMTVDESPAPAAPPQGAVSAAVPPPQPEEEMDGSGEVQAQERPTLYLDGGHAEGGGTAPAEIPAAVPHQTLMFSESAITDAPAQRTSNLPPEPPPSQPPRSVHKTMMFTEDALAGEMRELDGERTPEPEARAPVRETIKLHDEEIARKLAGARTASDFLITARPQPADLFDQGGPDGVTLIPRPADETAAESRLDLQDLPLVDAEPISQTPRRVQESCPPVVIIGETRRVTVHFLDGDVKRGIIKSFLSDSREVLLKPGEDQAPERLPVSLLKVIFVMTNPGTAPAAAPEGKPVIVTFRDGRSLKGISPDFMQGCSVFTLFPEPRQGNIEKIAVFREATDEVR